MANNNYFAVAFKILSYLRYCYENGQVPDIDILQAGTFNISQHQYIQTLQMLLEDGYIKGLMLTPTIDGVVLTNIQQIRITSSGLQYLSENSMMKKAYNVFKEVRDWLPLIK